MFSQAEGNQIGNGNPSAEAPGLQKCGQDARAPAALEHSIVPGHRGKNLREAGVVGERVLIAARN